MLRGHSVNEMQGKERKAIFMSTVRSSRDWQDHDRCAAPYIHPSLVRRMIFGCSQVARHRILNDPRRPNTAITRAQALLVVVGDPYVLYQV